MEAELLHNPKPKFHHIWDTNRKYKDYVYREMLVQEYLKN